MTDSERIYQELLEFPADQAIMQVLADALTDEGKHDLALAFRWAARHGKWPEPSHEFGIPGWFSEYNKLRVIPAYANVPASLFASICNHSFGFPRGSILDAFVRLSIGLKHCPQEETTCQMPASSLTPDSNATPRAATVSQEDHPATASQDDRCVRTA